MKPKSRILESQYNLIFSLINNLVLTIFGFLTRTVFVHSLGSDYLGLNGLFTNILSLLSLAELGIGSAITFSLYKPIAENDNEKIKSLMGLYKDSYRIVGGIILAVGLALTPFLKYIVNLDSGIEINYYAIYLMFLVNSVISYWFFAYRSVIIYANQEGYITTKIETIFNFVRYVLQFIALLAFENYYLYLLLPIISGIVKNIIVSNVAGKRYPVINEKNIEPLGKEERNKIFQNVFALSLFRISSVVYGATDNIIISRWLGTSIVGIVSNFTMIIQIVTSYINMLFQSMYASVGNLNATESIEYKYIIFKRLNFMNFWLYCYATICLGCFLNPCIKVWLGSEYCLSVSTVDLLAIVFLIPGLNNVINIYKDACGLFKEVQFRALATALVNLIISIILVKNIGINGVYIGTIIAYLTTIYMVDPRVVFSKVFKIRAVFYYRELLKKSILFGLLYGMCKLLMRQFIIESWFGLIFYFLLISGIVNGCLFIIYGHTQEFVYLKNIILELLHRLNRKEKIKK